MLLLYVVVFSLPFVLYGAAVALGVFGLARLGRVGAAAAIVIAGFIARGIAGHFRVWETAVWSFWYVAFVAGVVCGLLWATRLPRSPAGRDEWVPAALRGLPRSTLRPGKLARRNLLLLVERALPLTMVLNYCGEYLQRVASGRPTHYLHLNASWDYAKHFEGAPVAIAVMLVGCLLYEGLLSRLPPARSAAHADRRALLLLPVMLAPWLVYGLTRGFTFTLVPLVQGLAVYFFVVRRSPDPVADRTGTADASPRIAGRSEPRLPNLRRRRRYLLIGGALGAAVAAYAILSAGLENGDALAVAAEQMFFVTMPASIPLRAILVGDGAADFRWESTARLIPFLLAAPIANGLLLGWILARAAESRWVSVVGRPAGGEAVARGGAARVSRSGVIDRPSR